MCKYLNVTQIYLNHDSSDHHTCFFHPAHREMNQAGSAHTKRATALVLPAFSKLILCWQPGKLRLSARYAVHHMH